MPRLALQLGEVLEHLVGGGLVNMAVVVGDKFDELLHRVELRARHGGAFRQGCRQPPRRFRGDEVEYGGDIMQIRGEALRVEQGLPKRRVTTTAGCWRSGDVRYSDRASASSASLMAIAVPVIVS